MKRKILFLICFFPFTCLLMGATLLEGHTLGELKRDSAIKFEHFKKGYFNYYYVNKIREEKGQKLIAKSISFKCQAKRPEGVDQDDKTQKVWISVCKRKGFGGPDCREISSWSELTDTWKFINDDRGEIVIQSNNSDASIGCVETGRSEEPVR